MVLLLLMASSPPCLSWAAPSLLEGSQQRPPAEAPIYHTAMLTSLQAQLHVSARPLPHSKISLSADPAAIGLWVPAKVVQFSDRGCPSIAMLWQ